MFSSLQYCSNLKFYLFIFFMCVPVYFLSIFWEFEDLKCMKLSQFKLYSHPFLVYRTVDQSVSLCKSYTRNTDCGFCRQEVYIAFEERRQTSET